MAVHVRNMLDVIETFGEGAATELLSGLRYAINPSIEYLAREL